MMRALLDAATHLVCRHPRSVSSAGVLLAIISAAYAGTALRMNTNVDELGSASREYVQEFRRLVADYGDLDYIYVVVDAGDDTLLAERAIDELVVRLRQIEQLPAVEGYIEPDEQLRLATRAMADDDLAGLADAAAAFPVLAADGDAASVLRQAGAMLSRAVRPGVIRSVGNRPDNAAGGVLLLKALAAALPGSNSEAELSFLIDAPAQRRYFTSESGRLHLIRILPHKDFETLSVIDKPLARVRETIASIGNEFPGVEIGLTGKHVLLADQLRIASRDEIIWVQGLTQTQTGFAGYLANAPVDLGPLRQGDYVEFQASQINDWAIRAPSGRLHGHYTTRVIAAMPGNAYLWDLLEPDPIPPEWR